ncbi:MAG: glycerol-3-phosphate 1-O-acyltransferase PlsY [Gemmatimonadetes bacterium]|nr:glycerol-3-phosphate 1-O-acyltransferase PlsY [Gemmatimonadota bacterium]
MNPLLLLVLAYLLGAIPTSFWVGRSLYGVDLRHEGSGNLGATNTLRVLGWKAALPVMLVDVGKGWLPVWLFSRLDGAPWGWALAYGGAAILGHVFSVWVRFRGGKGVATSAGVFLGLAPLAVLAGFVVWMATALTTRIVSPASILAALTIPIALLFTPHRGGDALLAFTVGLAAFVLWAHRGNVRRLVRGEEHRFGRSLGRHVVPPLETDAPPDPPDEATRGADGTPSNPETSR